ncbi:MAG: helix-turn-helix transcriptional regulator [Treponemataceae bacterium]|nr:helix-turn-helix transcriptional regulator [Treponemataceae bacterium]
MVLFVGAGLYLTPTAQISIDITPSLELGINRFDNVVSVRAWKLLIIRNLVYDGTQRFTDFIRTIPGISKKVLTDNLRAPEADGLVRRKAFAKMPPRVEYSLSPLEKTLLPIIDAMKAWGAGYKKTRCVVKIPARF